MGIFPSKPTYSYQSRLTQLKFLLEDDDEDHIDLNDPDLINLLSSIQFLVSRKLFAENTRSTIIEEKEKTYFQNIINHYQACTVTAGAEFKPNVIKAFIADETELARNLITQYKKESEENILQRLPNPYAFLLLNDPQRFPFIVIPHAEDMIPPTTTKTEFVGTVTLQKSNNTNAKQVI